MRNERAWIRIGIAVEEEGTYVAALDHETLDVLAIHGERSRDGAVPPIAWRDRAEEMRRALRTLLARGGFPPERVLALCFSTTLGVRAALQAHPSLIGLITLDSKERASPPSLTEADLEAIPLLSGHAVPIARLVLRSSDLEGAEDWLDPLLALRARGAEGFVLVPTRERSHTEWTLLESRPRLGVPICSISEFPAASDPKLRLRAALCLVTALADVFTIGELLQECARQAGFRAPLFIVRNDGGLVPWSHLLHHPSLGLLSGPVAGILGALQRARLQEGILVQMGRSVSHVAMIQQGRAFEGEAELGNMRVPLRALEIFSLAVGSESLLSFRRGMIAGIGPWSASTLAMAPAQRATGEALEGARVVAFHPVPGSSEEFLAIATPDGHRYALTVGDAALCLGLDEADEERRAIARKAIERLAVRFALTPEDAAEVIVERAIGALADMVQKALRRHFRDPAPPLIGMGTSAPLLLPLLAQRLGLRSTLLEQGEMMSALGAATADLRETIEHSLAHSEEQELERWRQEAERTLLKWGAERASLRTTVHRDSVTQRARLTVTGRLSPHPERPSLRVTPDQRAALAATVMAIPEDHVELVAETEGFEIYQGRASRRRFLRWRETAQPKLCACDKEGNVVFALEEATITTTTAAEAPAILTRLLDRERAVAPSTRRYLLSATHCLDLTHAASPEQVQRWTERILCALLLTEPVFIVEGRSRG
ncbi:hypothetical protein HRbin10_00860 [bacterium HR10]|nr:hypothetical protein HRbin10_00860 [bacterium HR10]